MTSSNGVPCFLFLLLGIVCNVNAKRCTIPRRDLYGRSVYRPQYGSNTNRYPPGRRINHGTKIVIICKKDIYHDSARNFTISRCQDGRWLPALPRCRVQRRCRAPQAIPHATASEPITPYITFPHGTTVTYTCDVGKMTTGSDTVVCDDGKWTVSNFQCLVESDCIIPSAAQYKRALYRPQTGSSTSNYPAGSVISNGSTVVVICKKDIYGDVVNNWTLSECQSGEWIPVLSGCLDNRRCGEPPSIEHATTSERITPYITFPHDTTVTYTCDVGKMATGSDTVVCTDGQWSDTNFQCEDDPYYKPGTTTVLSTTTHGVGCSQFTIKNGKISVKDISNNTYTVTCNAGYRLKSTKTSNYRCSSGTWIGVVPECVRAPAQCEFSYTTRRRSVLKLKATGEVINAMNIDHWTQAVQTCKGKSRTTQRRAVRCVNGRWRPSLIRCPDIGNRHRTSDDITTGEMKTRTTTVDWRIPNMTSSTQTTAFTSTEMVILTSTEDQASSGITSSNQPYNVTTTHETVSTSSDDQAKSGRTSSNQPNNVTTTHATISASSEDRPTSDTTPSNQMTTAKTTHATISTSSDDQVTSDMTSPNQTTVTNTTQTTIMTSSEHQRTSGMTSPTEPTTVSTTQMSDIQYRIHIKDSGDNSPVYLILNGTLQTGVVLQLDGTGSTNNDVRQYEVTAANVGEIRRIRISNSNELSGAETSLKGLKFVSIHTGDNGGFYIERYTQHGGDGPAPVRGKPCKRHFERKLNKRPSDWSGNLAEYPNIDDATDCQLKCIEENFDCHIAYYHNTYKSCYVFENADLHMRDTILTTLSIFQRLDNC